MKKLFLFLLLALIPAFPQASSHTAFRIIQGTPKPAVCAVGDVWVDTTASPATTFNCLTANTWTAVGGAGTTINATNNVLPKRSSATTFADSSITDNGTTVSIAEPVTLTGSTAGAIGYPQGSTNAALAVCTTANTKCYQAPTAQTSNVETLAPATAQGVMSVVGSASAVTEGYSGDTNHSAVVTTGSGTSIGSTSLCSTTFCPVGTYRVNTYIDITTACGTSGSYTVNLIYTDDQGSKTIPININGTGAVPATGVLTTTSTANFGEDTQIIRSTGAASINYSTTAVACGTAGPMVGKLYLSVEAVQ